MRILATAKKIARMHIERIWAREVAQFDDWQLLICLHEIAERTDASPNEKLVDVADALGIDAVFQRKWRK